MVGLSIVLEKNSSGKNENNPQVISKVTMTKPTAPAPAPPFRGSSPAAGFLDRCFLCSRKLLAGKDIYMYKGDRAFCSVECRCNQILMDEEEINNNTNSGFNRENCSLAAIKGPKTSSQSSSSSSSSRRNHKGASCRNGANGFVF